MWILDGQIEKIECELNSEKDSLPFGPKVYASKILAWVFSENSEIEP